MYLKNGLSNICVTDSEKDPHFRQRFNQDHENTVTHHDNPGGTLLTSFPPESSKSAYSTRNTTLQSFSPPPLLGAIACLLRAQPYHRPWDGFNDNNPMTITTCPSFSSFFTRLVCVVSWQMYEIQLCPNEQETHSWGGRLQQKLGCRPSLCLLCRELCICSPQAIAKK